MNGWGDLVPRHGSLFYPCCGSDVQLPLEIASGRVDAIHFSDFKPPRLSNAGRAIQHVRTDVVHCPPITRGPSHKIERERRGYEGMRHYFKTMEGDPLSIVWHEYDAVHAFNAIADLAVFFFRCDCPHDGEGSSGVLWLQEQLFHRITDQLVDGGIIVTDGSNGYHPSQEVSWHPLWACWSEKMVTVPHQRQPEFRHGVWRFTCVGDVGMARHGLVYVWRGVRS